jgi:hypothetical protein
MEQRIGLLQGELEERMGKIRGALPAEIEDLARDMANEPAAREEVRRKVRGDDESAT